VSPWIVVAGYAGLLVLSERLLLGRIRMAAGEGD
jgi:hypothetical protein